MKQDLFFKILYALILVYGIITLQELVKKLPSPVRYQEAGTDSILDTHTGTIYIWEQHRGWSVLDPQGNIKRIKNLPQ